MLVRIERYRNGAWTGTDNTAVDPAAWSVSALIARLPEWSLQYPARLYVDNVMIAKSFPDRRRRKES